MQKFNLEDLELENEIVHKMRTFFVNKGWMEVYPTPQATIMSACENPNSIVKYQWYGNDKAKIQTNQMSLEYILLQNPSLKGVFCTTTSYREEKNPIEGRHATNGIFNMFELESHGGFEELKNTIFELLMTLGFEVPTQINYEDVCKEYNINTIEADDETRMWNEKGNSLALQYFPFISNPFWNMKAVGEVTNKMDIILYGQETIGSAERSCNVNDMRERFYSVENGEYCAKLFELFGKEQVEKELEEFLSLNFIPRYGAGIGLGRMIRAYKLLKNDKLTN